MTCKDNYFYDNQYNYVETNISNSIIIQSVKISVNTKLYYFKIFIYHKVKATLLSLGIFYHNIDNPVYIVYLSNKKQ